MAYPPRAHQQSLRPFSIPLNHPCIPPNHLRNPYPTPALLATPTGTPPHTSFAAPLTLSFALRTFPMRKNKKGQLHPNGLEAFLSDKAPVQGVTLQSPAHLVVIIDGLLHVSRYSRACGRVEEPWFFRDENSHQTARMTSFDYFSQTISHAYCFS